MPVLNKAFKVLFIVVFLLVGFLFLARQPLFEINKITVSILNEDKMYQEIPSQLKAELFAFQGKSFFDVPLQKVIEVAEKDIRVKEAHVFRRVPGRLNVELVLKQPYAVLIGKSDQKFPIAREGDLLPALSPGEFVDMPFLRGNEFENNQNRRKEVIEFLLQLPTEGPFTETSISEIWFRKKEGFTFFVGPEASEVFLGDRLDHKKVLEINKVLKYMKSKQLSGRIIDARFPKKVVVRLRNEN
ncbi:MAG: hypothetical protein R2827_09765 [Bdellovibrionales bacterium]